jgi:hypothetical protein
VCAHRIVVVIMVLIILALFISCDSIHVYNQVYTLTCFWDLSYIQGLFSFFDCTQLLPVCDCVGKQDSCDNARIVNPEKHYVPCFFGSYQDRIESTFHVALEE